MTALTGKLPASTRPVLKRVLFVLAILALYRVGASIPAPFASNDLEALSPSTSGPLNLFNLFSGGPLTTISLFALGVTPFISASIVMQVLTAMVPYIKELKKQGRSGVLRVNSWTRMLAIVIALVQSIFTAQSLKNRGLINPDASTLELAAFVAATLVGFLLLLWLAEMITRHGIGNGVTVLLTASILSSAWPLSTAFIDSYGITTFLVAIGSLIVLTAALVTLLRSEFRLPVIYGSKTSTADQTVSYLPFKIVQGGVAPIIFATSLIAGLVSVLNFLGVETFAANLSNPVSWLHIVLTAALIVLFAKLYDRTTSTPKDVAKDLIKEASFVPGVRPGDETSNLIDSISSRFVVVAALVLVPIALLPSFLIGVFDIAFLPVAGTSLLILVTAVLDIVRQARSVGSLYDYEHLNK